MDTFQFTCIFVLGAVTINAINKRKYNKIIKSLEADVIPEYMRGFRRGMAAGDQLRRTTDPTLVTFSLN